MALCQSRTLWKELSEVSPCCRSDYVRTKFRGVSGRRTNEVTCLRNLSCQCALLPGAAIASASGDGDGTPAGRPVVLGQRRERDGCSRAEGSRLPGPRGAEYLLAGLRRDRDQAAAARHCYYHRQPYSVGVTRR